ncbi:MAG: DNA repair protein RecO C-terminal domain-containing protein [Halobacteriovoraceae bacterium]|nr:DNA repair protein RecO C-terminal domain-containing protein [Halobacteriovoraceae bacterium]
MNSKIEGLILSKIPLQKRTQIVRLLLRNGKKISVLFPIKSKKHESVELAHMLKIELSPCKSTSEIYTAKEWNILWAPSKIRSDYLVFNITCLILEIIQSITASSDLHDPSYLSDTESSAIFSVASNVLYGLNIAPKKPHDHLLPFLGKLLIALGIFPRIDSCIECGRSLQSSSINLALDPGQGGFLCGYCLKINHSGYYASSSMQKLRDALHKISTTKYHEIDLRSNMTLFNSSLEYFCRQFEFSPHKFKSLPVIIKTFPASA